MDVCVYHAGKDAAARQRTQQDWTSGGTEVVIATVAFGMCALYFATAFSCETHVAETRCTNVP